MIILRPPRKKDGSRIVRLSDEIFGEGYLTLDDISERYLVLNVDGSLAGFVNTDIWDEESATGSKGTCLGLIETVVLHKRYRGAGLGTVLVASATAMLLQEGATIIECYATTWSDSGICFLEGSLERNDFTAIEHFHQHWKDDDSTFICPACTAHPCLCDATLYRREVNTRPGE